MLTSDLRCFFCSLLLSLICSQSSDNSLNIALLVDMLFPPLILWHALIFFKAKVPLYPPCHCLKMHSSGGVIVFQGAGEE